MEAKIKQRRRKRYVLDNWHRTLRASLVDERNCIPISILFGSNFDKLGHDGGSLTRPPPSATLGPRLTRIQNGGGARVCTTLFSPEIEFQHRLPVSRRFSDNYFFAKSGDLDQTIRLPPFDDRRFVEGARGGTGYVRGVRVSFSRLGAELRGGDPFAMQVTPQPPLEVSSSFGWPLPIRVNVHERVGAAVCEAARV